jgi:hypothetical protein
VLAYPNYVDADPAFFTVAFDGGAWRPSAPLTNLRERLLVKRARSVDCALASTRFWTDLGAPRDVRVIAIPFLTASRDALIRVRGFSTQDESGAALADTEWTQLYPIIYPFGSLPYGHPSMFDGRMTPEDAALFHMPFVHVLDAAVNAAWWLVEIDDTGSTLGSVEVPKLFLAPGWQPSVNMVYPYRRRYESRTVVQESQGGAEFFGVQAGRRVATFSFNLPEDEVETWVGDMHRRLGVHGQLFFIFNPDDTTHLHRRSFLARHRELDDLESAVYGRSSTVIQLQEVIA